MEGDRVLESQPPPIRPTLHDRSGRVQWRGLLRRGSYIHRLTIYNDTQPRVGTPKGIRIRLLAHRRPVRAVSQAYPTSANRPDFVRTRSAARLTRVDGLSWDVDSWRLGLR